VLYVAAFAAFLYVRWEYLFARREVKGYTLFRHEVVDALLRSPRLNTIVSAAKEDYAFGPNTELRISFREAPVLYVGARTSSPNPFGVPLPRLTCLRELLGAVYRAARFRKGFVETVVPEILFWPALLGGIVYGALALLDGIAVPPIDPELS
jgi:hypothetical protein